MVRIVADNDGQTALEREVRANAVRSAIEEAMIQHIARRIASPCAPHYDHVLTARRMLHYLQECAHVTPLRKFAWQREMFDEAIKPHISARDSDSQ